MRKKTIRKNRTGFLFVTLSLAAPLALADDSSFGPGCPGDFRECAPNERSFDRAEPDDASGDYVPGTSVFDEMWEVLGFAPFTTERTAVYSSPQPKANGTDDPLTAPGNGQISGVRADRAWQVTNGHSEAVIAILDTGIRWEETELRKKVFLNRGELPVPDGSCSAPADDLHDCNGDGVFDVEDYTGDSRVGPDDGPDGVPGELDAQDLIVAFSDGVDDDANGYVDDIAGWDFFDDDNDPFDASSYASSEDHGTGRAEEAGAKTNNRRGDVGVCPRCPILPLRIWDTFVVDANNWGLATIYAADVGAVATENAVGAITNTRFARKAAAYAVSKDVAIMAVSSDLNTADHNYPTNYNDTIFVSGIVPDVPEEDENPPEEAGRLPPVPAGLNAPVGTWFRDSGLTQYGGHHHINMMGSTGSQATGQAAGAAGLVASRGVEVTDEIGGPLTANEVKQLLTMTAEDVVPSNTLGTGIPDPSQPGWDQHFGYGRVDLEAAVEAVGPGTIPPEVSIQNPPWFHIIDPEADTFVLEGMVRADRADGVSYVVEVGPGIEPLDEQFVRVGTSPTATGANDVIATIDVDDVKSVFPPGKDFQAPPAAFGPPVQGSATVPSNEFLFTVRVRATDSNEVVGEDRRSLFLHRNPGIHAGDWPKFLNVGGEAGVKMADVGTCGETTPQGVLAPKVRAEIEPRVRLQDTTVDASVDVTLDARATEERRLPDGKAEIVFATSAGELEVFCEDGSRFPGFPVFPDELEVAANHQAAPGVTAIRNDVGLPRPSMPTPAVGDVDGDGLPEIVAAAGAKVYVWENDGTRKTGFPVEIDTSLSEPSLRTKTNHVKTGIFAAPALGDLDGNGGGLDIVVAAMDGRVYVWDPTGAPRSGFPVRLIDPEKVADGEAIGTESVTVPTLADLDGDGSTEIVVASNEVYSDGFDPAEFEEQLDRLADPLGLPSALAGAALDELLTQAGGSTRVYAVRGDGTANPNGPFLPGWPVKLGSVAPDALPLIGPGFTAAAADLDANPDTLEVVTSSTLGNVEVLRHDGVRVATMNPTSIGPLSNTVDPTAVFNLFEYPIVADVNGDGRREIVKPGITTGGVVNLVLVGQNMPFNHVVHAWDAATGEALPAFPKATDDWMLLSQPAVADVGSPAPGVADGHPEVVIGTGLYLLHAYGPLGVEPAGWPKMLGGWIASTPAVGDVDGDGKVEVASATREGFLFLFDTDGSTGTNDQWWGFHHDAWNTGNVTIDPRR